MLGDVQELEVGSFRLAYCHRGRMLTGPLRLELLDVGLRHHSAVRQAGEDVDALAALPGLDQALHAEPALGRGPLHDGAVPLSGLDALEADRAASVADERDLPALQRL